jgi:HTH-type transcriptional repressor of NAD biosynthesis genes
VLAKTGLIVGKFDPPHRGHDVLLDVAQAHAERVIVQLWDYPQQQTPAALRASWLRQIHPGVDVRVVPDDPAVASDDMAAQARHAERFLDGATVDVLFSSEPYGEGLARELGARHYNVDRDRRWVPVTGTKIRRAPLEHLQWLQPVVRAHFVKRVAAVGAESTGKSSLCQRLAKHYGTTWIGEYGRDYTLEKLRSLELGRWTADEFVHIAWEQQRREDEAARAANKLLFCDTDAFATEIWHERYVGSPPIWLAPPSKISLYLVPFPDVPFVADEIRDGAHLRFWMHERFVEELAKRERSYVVLQGAYEERDAQAIAAIDALLARENYAE